MRARPDDPLDPWCAIAAPGCSGRATARHHRKLRKHGGEDDRANTLDVCRPCHDVAHANPLLAFEHGWLVHPWEDPADVAVRRMS